MSMNREPLQIEYFPSGKKYSSRKTNVGIFSSYDRKLAYILCFTPDFEESIKQARKTLGLEKPFNYPENASVADILTLFSKLKYERATLDKLTNEIILRHDIPKYWDFSIKTAIVTNTILIPEEYGPILATKPDLTHIISQINDISDTDTLLFILTKRLIDAYEYPALRITRKITANELSEWVEANPEDFNNIQENLPQQKETKMDQEALFWGYIAEMFARQAPDTKNVYSKILKRLDELEKYQEKRGYENILVAPDRQTLAKLHKSYKNLLKLHSH